MEQLKKYILAVTHMKLLVLSPSIYAVAVVLVANGLF